MFLGMLLLHYSHVWCVVCDFREDLGWLHLLFCFYKDYVISTTLRFELTEKLYLKRHLVVLLNYLGEQVHCPTVTVML